MPLGDSITYGTGAAGGYRTRLYADLTNAGYTFNFIGSATDNSSVPLTTAGQTHHEGHSGYYIRQISDNLDGNDHSRGNNGGFRLNAAVQPDYILLLIGTNDFCCTGPEGSADAIPRLDGLIAKLVTLRPNAWLIVSNLPLVRSNPTAESYIETQFNPRVADLVRSHASLGQKVSFLDIHSVLSAGDLGDGVHPNQTGYDKMGDAWSGAIQALALRGAGSTLAAPTTEAAAVHLRVVPALQAQRTRRE